MMLLRLLCFLHIVISALEAQEVKVSPEVTGVVGHDVTLPCQYIPRSFRERIYRVQWTLKSPGGEDIDIIDNRESVRVQDSFLKGRVEIVEQSLIIRDVKKNDSGSYTCTVTAFLTGSSSGTTDLVVQGLLCIEEVSPVYPKIIIGGVFVLIVGTMLTTTHCIIRKRYRRCSGV
ncbi:nectin-2-like [Cottoperca gobio]|uniref:Nectin-2-like n=1 Tax=Cottoperca gobio TaxID=56716 RepID=A0A6J2RBL9_COTGO|nr:nectin-2-like [Cottoperca gobio]